MTSVSIGKYGENLARKFLEGKGYEILCMNYSSFYGEIDIISKKGDILVFVEVKARKNVDFGYPFEAVDRFKMEKILTTSYFYLQENNIEDVQLRFDIVEVYLRDKKINHMENVFELS